MNELTPFIAGPVIGLLGIWLGYLGYKRGMRADDAAQDNAAHAGVYAGYDGLLHRYQEDHLDCRRRLTESQTEVARLAALLREKERG